MLATTLSALYGKLLVVMGIAFPMAEVISTYIPPSFYEVSGSPIPFNSITSNIYLCSAGILSLSVCGQHAVSLLHVRDDSVGTAEDDESRK